MLENRRRPLTLAGLLAGLMVVAVGAQAPLPEASVKAAFVLRFSEFVSWPPGTRTSEAPTVCLSPAHPFGAAFVAAPGPRTRRIVVQDLPGPETLRGCDVLYVAPADARLLAEAATLPILTVGDQPDFCQRGGVINLLVIDGRVRFEVGLAQATRVGLKIDSQLLRLATRVHGGHR